MNPKGMPVKGLVDKGFCQSPAKFKSVISHYKQQKKSDSFRRPTFLYCYREYLLITLQLPLSPQPWEPPQREPLP